MAAARAALTEDDLRMLVKGPTADERAGLPAPPP